MCTDRTRLWLITVSLSLSVAGDKDPELGPDDLAH
jgi:hypothetical protein